MSNKQTVLTALGCAGSLAAMLAVASPAVASSTATSPMATDATANADDGLTMLTHAESNPIMDALSCGCARCAMAGTQSI